VFTVEALKNFIRWRNIIHFFPAEKKKKKNVKPSSTGWSFRKFGMKVYVVWTYPDWRNTRLRLIWPHEQRYNLIDSLDLQFISIKVIKG
jgi:hypothetical protein